MIYFLLLWHSIGPQKGGFLRVQVNPRGLTSALQCHAFAVLQLAIKHEALKNRQIAFFFGVGPLFLRSFGGVR